MTAPTQELELKARSMETEAAALTVVDEAGYRVANEFGRAAKALLAEIDASYDPIIAQAHATHKAAIEAKKKQAAPVEAAARLVAGKMTAWYRAEQARIAEERRKAEEEARRKAEEEALKTAETLASMGMAEAADAALTEVVPERVEAPEAPRLDGVSYRETWRAEVVDLMTLVKAVAQGAQPLAYLAADTTALNAAARAYKGSMTIPGVRMVSETVQARRG